MSLVLVPGVLGGLLQKDGKDVFALTAGAGFRALFSGGGASPTCSSLEPAWKPAGQATRRSASAGPW